MNKETFLKGKANTSKSPLSVEQLTVHYHKTPALWDVSFEIPEPLLLAVVGPNGAGKSSLIKGALGLIHKSSGRVTFFGSPIEKIRGKVAYVPQRESVDWTFPITVRELVIMGRYHHLSLFQRPRAADWEAADALIERVGLLPYRDRQIGQLSGGQQQRAFLARALLQEAPITIMDEPFAGIDQTTEGLLFEILKEMKQKGQTVMVVYHDLEGVKRHFDWALLLNRCLISFGPVDVALSSANLERAYGTTVTLLDDALRLSKEME